MGHDILDTDNQFFPSTCGLSGSNAVTILSREDLALKVLPFPFRQLFFQAESDMLVVWREGEPWFFRDGDELSFVMFNGTELAQ
jgi:hypothetical protein